MGFVVTTPYQLFHYGAIRAHLSGTVTAFIEIRDDDFGVTRELIKQHLGACDVRWIDSDDLKSIDGQCDVLVCQTPVPVLKFFTRSRVVAQQYSLAKEQYQYGIWRAQADLNLMYGEYSAHKCAPFSPAVAVGNPLFDGFLPTDGLLPLRPRAASRPKVLYMPTYGDLSNSTEVLTSLVAQDIDLAVKAHHADFEIAALAAEHDVPLYGSDAHPAALIREHDLVVSDYSGAIYDALALRTPVALVSDVNQASASLARLSDEDLSRSAVAGLAATWQLDRPLQESYDVSRQRLSDEGAYRAFLDEFFVNPGRGGHACARRIEALVDTPAEPTFTTTLIRDTVRGYIETNRDLRTRLKSASTRRRSRGIKRSVRAAARRMLAGLPGGNSIIRRVRGAAAPEATTDSGPSQLSPLAPRRRIETMNLVSAALTASGVDHRCDASVYRAYIGVREGDLDGILTALRTLELGTEPIEIRIGTLTRYGKPLDPSTLRMADLVHAESIVVDVPYRQGAFVLDQSAGVEILMLVSRDDRLVARRSRADKPDWTHDFSAASAPGTSAPVGLTSAPQQVDVVYTWVDSSDREWLAERQRWSEQTEIVMDSAANDERYLDREELRYSLRSLAMYAPFVRNIYIVTHGHRPSWLIDDDRIRIVPHTEIFPDPTVLPTFNSHAIEANLHRIPGLSEHFLYFNDDVFLGREATFDDFYTKAGLMKCRFSPSSFVASDEPAPTAIPTDWASYNAVKLMHDDFGLTFERKLMHVPHPLRRSVLDDMESRYPEEFARTRASRFREHGDLAIPSMFAPYFAIATHQAVEWPHGGGEYVYVDTGRADFAARMRKVMAKGPKFLCMNVTRHTDIDLPTQARMLREFLGELYPIPSPFERSE